MGKSLPYLMAILALLLTSSAFAEEYECFANDAIQWKHGKLEREKAQYPDSNTHLLFDEASQKLSIARTHDALLSPMQMKIIQKGPDDNWDLIAISVKEKTDDHSYGGGSILTIRAFDKSAGIIFSLYEGDVFVVGKCTVFHP